VAAAGQFAASIPGIARNIDEAATGARGVSTTIAGVPQAADDTGTAAGQVLETARELSQRAGDMRRFIETFVHQVRAA